MHDQPNVAWIVDRFVEMMFDWVASDSKIAQFSVEEIASALEDQYDGLGDHYKEWYGEDE